MVLGQPNFKDNMNMLFFFFFFSETGCVKLCSHTPKLNLHIVPNVKFMERADLDWELENCWVGMAHSTPPNLN
jgi:hypothetical protein